MAPGPTTRGQGTFEYILLLGGALLITSLSLFVLTQSQPEIGTDKQCAIAARQSLECFGPGGTFDDTKTFTFQSQSTPCNCATASQGGQSAQNPAGGQGGVPAGGSGTGGTGSGGTGGTGGATGGTQPGGTGSAPISSPTPQASPTPASSPAAPEVSPSPQSSPMATPDPSWPQCRQPITFTVSTTRAQNGYCGQWNSAAGRYENRWNFITGRLEYVPPAGAYNPRIYINDYGASHGSRLNVRINEVGLDEENPNDANYNFPTTTAWIAGVFHCGWSEHAYPYKEIQVQRETPQDVGKFVVDMFDASAGGDAGTTWTWGFAGELRYQAASCSTEPISVTTTGSNGAPSASPAPVTSPQVSPSPSPAASPTPSPTPTATPSPTPVPASWASCGVTKYIPLVSRSSAGPSTVRSGEYELSVLNAGIPSEARIRSVYFAPRDQGDRDDGGCPNVYFNGQPVNNPSCTVCTSPSGGAYCGSYGFQAFAGPINYPSPGIQLPLTFSGTVSTIADLGYDTTYYSSLHGYATISYRAPACS